MDYNFFFKAKPDGHLKIYEYILIDEKWFHITQAKRSN